MGIKGIMAIGLLVTVAGCRSGAPPKPSFIDGPLDAVVNKMGYPHSQREFEGDIVYSWTSSGLKTRWILIHSRENCTMDVGVRDGRVKNINYNGDGGPCDELRDKLESE